MKRLFIIIAALLLTLTIWAQSPQKMSYQAVIRDGNSILVTSHSVGVRVSILLGSATGTEIYKEIYNPNPQTNANGLVTIEIGGGIPLTGTFAAIDWSAGTYFIKTETDPTGGTSYTITGTSQLLSVPYALYAKSVASYPETDPVFGVWNKSSGISIAASQVSDFQSSVTNNTSVLANTAKVTNATHTGDVTGSGVLTLTTVNSNAGTFNNITINAKGLATAGSNVSYLTSETDPIWITANVNYYTKTNMQTSGASQLHFNNLTNTPTTILGYGITDAVTTTGNQTIAGNKTFSNTIIATQQGIGTATPDASAALEISSTTQGFLPPRMTQVQRDAITPVEGLIVYNSSTKRPNYYDGNDTEWKNYDGTSAKTLTVAIGDSYQGGKVAYIFQSGDAGYEAGQIHGLIAALSDQSTGVEWGCNGTIISGADGTAIGTGNQNTKDIVTGCTAAGIAAKLCYNLTFNGYSDWYLPSKDELNKLYLSKEAIGGFANNAYWSSTEISSNAAWGQSFSVGNQGSSTKNFAYYVRAIRAF